jgi:enolase
VPSGASAGSHEAHELRDGGERYEGRGVLRAVDNVMGPFAEAVIGLDATRQRDVDAALAATDGSPNLSRLGANAALSISLASALAAASAAGVSLARHLAGPGDLLLPMPMFNIISGGAHANQLLDVQDFLALPQGARSFAEALEWGVAVREAATRRAQKAGHTFATLVADEGGLGLPLASNRAALELLTLAIQDAGLRPGADVGIAIDVAASELYRDGQYSLRSEGRVLSSSDLITELIGWVDEFPILSIEDPLDEDDWDGWEQITAALGEKVELVGDDLFVTQLNRLNEGIARHAANSVLVKVNQNGLVSRAQEVLETAHAEGYRTVVSARSGDTEDVWLADIAVGWRAAQIKVGSTQRSERNAKWNRLLELEATEATTFGGPWNERR